MIKDRLEAEVAVVTYPIGAEKEFTGVIDIINEKALIWKDEKRQ